MVIIFETKRLRVRRLKILDFEPFHEMQSNLNVMQYVRASTMTFQENKDELPKLINLYDKPDNDFWIYAIERKLDAVFVGTIAFVKDENKEDEIGYRFLERYWGNGYGTEIVNGMVNYCKQKGFVKLIACVVNNNIVSTKIVKKAGFKFVEDFVSDDLKVPEQKFELIL